MGGTCSKARGGKWNRVRSAPVHRRSWWAMWLWSGPRCFPVERRDRRRMFRPSCAATARAPANCCGPFTRFRAWVNSATTRGRTIRGSTPATPACGRRWPRTWNLGYVYLPIEMPTGDYYGGHRPGDNLFADSLVCLDAKTGEAHLALPDGASRHLGLGSGIAAGPAGCDGGREAGEGGRADHQAGFTFVFDRVTGKPIWPIEERPVPASTVPGEITSPTQPFPTKPRRSIATASGRTM